MYEIKYIDKIIRVLGISLVLVGLVSCSNDDDKGENADTSVSTSNLKGTYAYIGASVAKAVDLNGDGVFNNDLKKEGCKTCTLDNNISITETTYSFIMKGTECGSTETNLNFTYKLDSAAKTITLFDNGTKTGEISNVNISSFNGTKSYVFYAYDSKLEQNVAYTMTSI